MNIVNYNYGYFHPKATVFGIDEFDLPNKKIILFNNDNKIRYVLPIVRSSAKSHNINIRVAGFASYVMWNIKQILQKSIRINRKWQRRRL